MKLKDWFKSLGRNKKLIRSVGSAVAMLMLATTAVTSVACSKNGGDKSQESSSSESSVVVPKGPYTVTFESNGGSTVGDVVVESGATVSKPADPKRDGYVFVGWYSDSDFTTPFYFGAQLVKEDITLYARWVESAGEKEEYTVGLDLGYDNLMLDSVKTVDGKLYNLPVPEREGYTFVGWWVSMYNDADKLSYVYTEDVTLTQNVTLFARWESEAATNKLATPVVRVEKDKIVWDGVQNASRYKVEVTGPEGFTAIDKGVGETSVSVDFEAAPAGDYVIKVTATGSGEDSDPAVVYYKNKALAAVSLFSVVGDSTLKFNAVENAEKYLISVKCGTYGHEHVNVDNGPSTTYDFSACDMKADGIEFTVTAVADGYISSVSETYKLVRTLDEVAGLSVSKDDLVTWNPVANAKEYVVVVMGNDVTVSATVTETKYNLRDLTTGNYTVLVYAKTRGYNSAAATTLQYAKQNIATPNTVSLQGETISWNEVAGAKKYLVKIGDKLFETRTNSLALVKGAHYNEKAEACDISIMAVADEYANSSQFSDVITVRFGTLDAASLVYAKGEISWSPVINAQKYEVKVNGGAVFTVDGSATKTPVTLTTAGLNTISVRCFDVSGKASDWAEVDTTAYAIEFESCGGDEVETQYKAAGDPFTLPEAVRSGYDLTGWYSTPEGQAAGSIKYENGALFDGKSDITMYAAWTGKKYKVTYNYDGKGIINGATTTQVQYSKDYKLAAPKSTDGAVMFVGWFSEPKGRGVQYSDINGNSLTPWETPNNMTLYAYWATIFSFSLRPDGTYSVSQGRDLKTSESIKKITVPSQYQGIDVTAVAGYAFSGCSRLEEINIPDTIEVIETDTAFYNCKRLEAVNIYKVEGVPGERLWSSTDGVLIFKDNVIGQYSLKYVPAVISGSFRIPDGVTEIPLKSFSASHINEIIIPTSVMVIQESAFFNCQQLTSVRFEEVPEGGDIHALEIKAKAFQNCGALETITLPARLTTISIDMFSGCNALANIHVEEGSKDYSSKGGVLCTVDGRTLLMCPTARAGSYTIPQGVTVIGESAFVGCNRLTEVIIPLWVTEVGNHAFEGCKELGRVVFQGGGLAPQTVGNYAFNDCEKLTTVDFAEDCNVAMLGGNAFSNTAIRRLVIPGNMAKIGDYAFADCADMASVTFSEGGVDLTIGSFVFQNCIGIKQIYLPTTVVEFKSAVFDGCKNLERITVDPNNQYLMDKDGVLFSKDETVLKFYPIGRKGEYVIPETVKKIDDIVFKNNINLTKITLGENIISIGANAFDGCTELETVVISEEGDALTLGKYAFANCIRLNNVTLPERVTAITDYLFYGSSSLTDLTIKGDVKTIGAYAFASTGLSTLSLPETVTSLGDYAFSGSDIVDIEIPKNITTLGKYVFSGCKSLKNVTFAEGYAGKTIPQYAFSESTIESITVPTAITKIDNYAFDKANQLVEVNFDEGSKLTTIGTYVFRECMQLASFDLPDSVTALGNYSFYRCYGLEDFNVSENSKLKTIGTYAFQNTAIKDFYVPKTVTSLGNYSFSYTRDMETMEFAMDGTAGLTLGTYVFYYSGIKELNLPKRLTKLTMSTSNSVETYVNNIFTYARNLKAINIEEGCTKYKSVDGIVYSPDMTRVIVCPQGWVGPDGKGEVTIPNTVTKIHDMAFNGCAFIKKVTFEELDEGQTGELRIGVTTKEQANLVDCTFSTTGKMFNGCTQLAEVHLPQHLTYIGRYAFADCSVLSNVVIPKSVVILDNAAFRASGIEEVVFEKDENNERALKVINGTAFGYTTTLKKFEVPKEVTVLQSQTFGYDTNLTELTFEEGSQLYELKGTVFTGAGFEHIDLPETLTVVSSSSLAYYLPLKELHIPTNVENPLYLLNGLYELEKVTLDPAHPTYTAKDGVVFSKEGDQIVYVPAAKTGEYRIPDGITSISEDVFQGTGIEKLIIPGSVTYIGDYGFWASNIKEVVFEEGT
ncbi:MAG: leucine-rich repeat protein, partial [Clostridia bacterium]|nr:leucine-rich repeat protein [Clostridia bacterium]